MTTKMSLKAARVNAGLSQDAAAKRLGKGKQTLSNWETGRTKIDAESFLELCRIYNCKAEDIFLPQVLTSS